MVSDLSNLPAERVLKDIRLTALASIIESWPQHFPLPEAQFWLPRTQAVNRERNATITPRTRPLEEMKRPGDVYLSRWVEERAKTGYQGNRVCQATCDKGKKLNIRYMGRRIGVESKLDKESFTGAWPNTAMRYLDE